jgi:hypothetical protein
MQDLQIMKKRFPMFFSRNTVFTGMLLSLVSVFSFSLLSISFSLTFATSPAFDESLIPDKEIINQKNDFIQTQGNGSSHLGSGYADILAVNYVSDGKTLNATF